MPYILIIVCAVLGFAYALLRNQPGILDDVVRVREHIGPLESISWRSMSLRMSTGALLVVPNSEIASQVLEVVPAHESTASRISVPVPIAVSPRKVFEIIANVIHSVPGVNPAIEPMIHCGEVLIANHGDALMTYDILYYPVEYGDATHTDAVVRERIWYAFARNGIIRLYGPKPDASPNADVTVISEMPALLNLDPQLGERLARGARMHLYSSGEPVVPPRAAQCSLFAIARGMVSVQATATDRVERPEAPVSSGAETSLWNERMIDRIAEEYAEHIGPIAEILVRNAARNCDDPYQLYQLLAEEIADADSRAAFLSNAPAHGSLLLRRGEYFGVAAYISGRPQHREEMHAVDEVELVELDRQSLLQALKEDPECGAEFCHRLTDAGGDTNTDVDVVASAPAFTG